MVLENYGVKLTRLTEDKIELVRQWRNDPKTNQYLNFRGYITPEMQKNWFDKINNDTNYYFIISYNDDELGIINIKDIDYVEKKGEGGIFIFDDKYLCTDLAYRAHLVLFDFVFNVLNINSITAKVQSKNSKAKRLTDYMGLVEDKTQADLEMIDYILTREAYKNNNNRLHFITKWEKLKNKN